MTDTPKKSEPEAAPRSKAGTLATKPKMDKDGGRVMDKETGLPEFEDESEYERSLRVHSGDRPKVETEAETRRRITTHGKES